MQHEPHTPDPEQDLHPGHTADRSDQPPIPTVRPSVTPTAGKADLGKRAIATLIDGVVGMVLAVVPVLGGILAAAYWLVRDGLEVDFMDGRSIGKKVMKLRPVRLDGRPMDLATSAQRNWMFAFGGVVALLSAIPFVGWLLIIPVGFLALALGIFEIFRVLTDDQGRRLGDAMAGTKVVEVAD